MLADMQTLEDTLTTLLAPHTGYAEGSLSYTSEEGIEEELTRLYVSVSYAPLQQKFYDLTIHTSPINRPPMQIRTEIYRTPWWVKGLAAVGGIVAVETARNEDWIAAGVAAAATGAIIAIDL